jgi:hypothetical protein
MQFRNEQRCDRELRAHGLDNFVPVERELSPNGDFCNLDGVDMDDYRHR